MDNKLGKPVKKFKRDRTEGSKDTDLLSRYSRLVAGMASTVHHRRVVPIPRNSIEISLQKLVTKFERDPTVGSFDTDLLSRYSGLVGGMSPTVHRRRVVPIPGNTMENSLQQHVKKFERDPTVGSLDTDLLS